ncbi:hypothetical protein G7046_g8959 [Stylonectria norvegica]|nr:hypothetical protein G7046_g8959 [Stylonectria norvegica]
MSEPSSPDSIQHPFSESSRPGSRRQPEFEPLPPPAEQIKYWNEYDDGSECGRTDDEYAIYVNPDQGSTFPGLEYLQHMFKGPLDKARRLFKLNKPAERRPLLASNRTPVGYSSTALNSESEEEGYASSECYPSSGYAAVYALPSLTQQKADRYRETALFWGTVGCFVASFILLAIAGTLILTGKHKLRVEVDAGVTVGVVASLFSACTALGMTMYRRDPLRLLYRLMVTTTFLTSCLLNGMLLILVVGNTP